MRRRQGYGTGVLLCAAFASVAVAAGLAGCITPLDPGPPVDPRQAARSDAAQGWTDEDRDFFWFTNQGSQLIPRDWFLALEREDSQALFLSDSLARFGYLSAGPSARNPDRLPLGFAVDQGRTRAWVGMTCAACHTSEITRGGVTLRIEGAPAQADMYALLDALNRSLLKTANDDATFDRFAVRVLGPGSSAEQRRLLRDSSTGLRPWATDFSVFVQQSKASTAWGPRRLDAFGMIFNRVTAIDLGLPANSQPPNAPVSYPFLWGTSWHDYTQWTGAVHNASETERLARNVGQVLGVFGTLDVSPGHLGYPSSADMKNLLQLEQTVSRLKAPEWPAALFGAPAAQRLASGAQLYSNNCAGCHRLVPRDNQLQAVQVTRVPITTVGTDDATARVAASRMAQTGVLKGRPMEYLGGRALRDTELAADILDHAVIGALVNGPFASAARPSAAASPAPAAAAAASPVKPMFASAVPDMHYKARPLNGIWATAPYLHNGSVRTLRQLLLPPQQRETTFLVGSREFDPVEVGFVSAGAPGAAPPFLFDTRIPGNSNRGHVFGTGLSDSQKADLLEYLKTL